jgi:hypothetical protein
VGWTRATLSPPLNPSLLALILNAFLGRSKFFYIFLVQKLIDFLRCIRSFAPKFCLDAIYLEFLFFYSNYEDVVEHLSGYSYFHS